VQGQVDEANSMKIAVLMRPGRIDIGQLAARHPGAIVRAGRGRRRPRAGIAGCRSARDGEHALRCGRGGDRQARRGLKWIQFTTSGLDAALRAGGFPEGAVVTNGAHQLISETGCS